MENNRGTLLIRLIGWGLVLFTGYRAVHVVQTTLPSDSDSQMLGYVALIGLDLAMMAWADFSAKHAHGVQQEISDLMVVVTLAGVALNTVGDTVLTFYGQANNAALQMAIVWAVPTIIVANVAAVVAVIRLDPATEQERAERDFVFTVMHQKSNNLRRQAAQIAARITPEDTRLRAAELLAQVTGRTDGDGVPTLEELKASMEEFAPTRRTQKREGIKGVMKDMSAWLDGLRGGKRAPAPEQPATKESASIEMLLKRIEDLQAQIHASAAQPGTNKSPNGTHESVGANEGKG